MAKTSLIWLICLLFNYNFCNATNFFFSWEVLVDYNSAVASLRSADLNNDGTEDVVFSVLDANNDTARAGIICIDGSNGNILWHTKSSESIFGSALFLDVNDDNVDDIILSGRDGALMCLNGHDGIVIWNARDHFGSSSILNSYNFYNPKSIPDQNGDQINDILVSNGGNPNIAPNGPNRQTGYLMTINAANGNILQLDSVPDNKETYFSPILLDFDNNQQLDVIYGTGGETDSGSLWICALQDFVDGKLRSNSKRLDGPYQKGFIQPCIISDFNADNQYDILSINFDGRIGLIDGSDFSKVWQHTFEGYEMYTEPTLVNYNNDLFLDVNLTLSKGFFNEIMGYDSFRSVFIDGKDGTISEWTNNKGNMFQLASNLSYTQSAKSNLIYVSNFLIDNSKFGLSIAEYNIDGDTYNYIVDTTEGLNFFSTPLLKDIDNDNLAELIFSYSSQSKVHIKCLDTDIPASSILWGQYYGNDANSIYDNRNINTPIRENTINSIGIVPSLANDFIRIEDTKLGNYSIYDENGKIVLKGKLNKNYKIDVSTIVAGNYFLLFRNLDGAFGTGQFVKQ